MKIVSPSECPSCGSTLEKVKDQLFCRNSEECPAQSSKKLVDFCKKLKFKGFGPVQLETLEFTSFNDLVDLTPAYAMEKGLTEHMANKLVTIVSDRLSQGLTPNDFLAACSIPMIGEGSMRKLSFDKIEDLTYKLCKSQGLGDKASNSLIEWINTQWNKYKSSWEAHLTSKKPVDVTNVPARGTVCITGKLLDYKNRKEAGAYLETLGFTIKSSVTKAVDYLICEDGKTTSSSYTKAESYNIQITTIKNLIEDIK